MTHLRENETENKETVENRSCIVLRAGMVDLPLVDEEMRRLQELRYAGAIPDTLILVEHPEIVTIGRRSNRDGVAAPFGFRTHVVDRGGGITWHGPGQLTVYPIFHWTLPGERSISAVIDRMEEWSIQSLAEFGVTGSRDARMHGAWVDGKKIASIGLSFSHWITRHGFTVNLDTPAGRVEAVSGCGLPADTTTCISRVAGRRIDRIQFETILLEKMPFVIRRSVQQLVEVAENPPWRV